MHADATLPLARTRVTVVLREALITGALGAATIMVWFFGLDLLAGRPLYTPTVLGTVLLGGDAASLETLAVSVPLVLLYTVVHALSFCAVGYLASWLLGVAEAHPRWIFGLLLFFILFFCGFLAVPVVVEPGLFEVVTIPAILAGNLLAAFVMGWYLWRRHPLDLKQLM